MGFAYALPILPRSSRKALVITDYYRGDIQIEAMAPETQF